MTRPGLVVLAAAVIAIGGIAIYFAPDLQARFARPARVAEHIRNESPPEPSSKPEAPLRAALPWEPGSVWTFTINDTADATPREVSFRVESGTANSCLGGDWKKLELLKGDYKGLSEPAWNLDGEELRVLLASDICDGYDQLDGTVKAGRFSGRHSQFGVEGSTDVGTAAGVRKR